MFGRFRRRQCGQRCGCGPTGEPGMCCTHPLSDFAQGAEVVVVANQDRKPLEMGLFTGAFITVIKNRPADANMVIAAGESRYILAKESAEKVQVR